MIINSCKKFFLNMNFYIIPSPIGNLDDITIRVIDIIKKIDFLVVENRTITQNLLKKVLSFHQVLVPFEVERPLVRSLFEMILPSLWILLFFHR